MPSLLFNALLINEIGTRHKSSAQLLNEKGGTGEGPPMQLQKNVESLMMMLKNSTLFIHPHTIFSPPCAIKHLDF